jgi:hypothetical protein
METDSRQFGTQEKVKETSPVSRSARNADKPALMTRRRLSIEQFRLFCRTKETAAQDATQIPPTQLGGAFFEGVG